MSRIVQRCELAIVTAGPEDIANHVESTYHIRPITRREVQEKQRNNTKCHSPCKCLNAGKIQISDLNIVAGTSSSGYLKSIARCEIKQIDAYATSHGQKGTPWQYTNLR